MADQEDVRRIALALPGAIQDEKGFAFGIVNRGKKKGFVWVWLERIDPKKGRVPNPAVLGVRVADESEKQMLLASDTEKFFTEPHYDGYPAILVRLAQIDTAELAELITDAWRCLAPETLLRELDTQGEQDTQ